MANHMAEIAKMLGVELGEVFYIKEQSDIKCTIYNDGLYVYPIKDDDYILPSDAQVLSRLLEGNINIKRKPWKPNDGEGYYAVECGGNVSFKKFYNDKFSADDMNYYKLGNCYRTYEEASADSDKWVAFYTSDEILEV